MATAIEIAQRALKRLRVVGAGETPSADQINDATAALSALIAAWDIDGLSGDTLPIDARFEQGVTAMLSVRLAGDYGKTPDAILMRDAKEGERALGSFIAVPQSSFDRALKWSGPSANVGIILGCTTDIMSFWQANTDYRLRDVVSNGANIYECTSAGTSASSGGPTGTGTDITDGTCVWVWRRVDGSRNTGIVALP